MAGQKSGFHRIWGAALLLMGVGVLYRIPQVMPRIEEITYFAGATWFVRASFYLIAVLLIGGGFKKLYDSFRDRADDDA